MRLSGDDYCYEANFKRLGFWDAQVFSFLEEATYNGNRFSLTLLSGLSSLFGPKFNGILPSLAIILWIGGLALAIKAFANANHYKLHPFALLLGAELLVFFSLYLAPDRSQILYWRSGMLPYLAPLITLSYISAVITRPLNHARSGIFSFCLIFILSFLSGGFSETGAALQAGWLFLYLIWVILTVIKGSANLRSMNPLIISALLGTLLAMAALFLSPTNEIRLAGSPAPQDLLSTAKMSAYHAYIFIYASFKGLPLQSAITFVFSAVFSYVVFSTNKPAEFTRPVWHSLGWFVLIPAAAYWLIFCTVAPSAYVQRDYPEPRALITSRFIMVTALAVLGILSGKVSFRIFSKFPKRLSPYVFASLSILMIGLSIYPIRASRETFLELPRYQRWSAFWDERHTILQSAKQVGLKEVEVVEIDHIIPRVGDLSPDPNFWYNNCAEWYYELNSIKANQPGWDE